MGSEEEARGTAGPGGAEREGAESEASDRERLIGVINELSASQGYFETSVEEIVERASVSRESFDALFQGSKEALQEAADNALTNQTVRVLSETFDPDRSEKESALAIGKVVLEMVAEDPALAHLMVIGARQMGPPDSVKAYEAGSRVISVMIERAWDYSESGVQPANVGRAALGGAEAVMRREIMAGRAAELPRLLPDFIYAVFVPFVGQEEALELASKARKLLVGTKWE